MINETPDITISKITELIRKGADSLLRQPKSSGQYVLSARSEIAEANLAVHIASAFIQEKKYAVWAEAPLIDPKKEKQRRRRRRERKEK